MQISWFLGFGWVSILTVVACGIGINLLDGPVVWVLYVPFLLVAINMTARFRLFTTQPWRRVHSRAMMVFGELAGREYDTAKSENREYDIATPCAELASRLFGENDAEAAGLLPDEKRKAYYKGLVNQYPAVFLEGIPKEEQAKVLGGIDRDIETSKLGPDVLIARAIEAKHSRLEAARYLHALMLGKVA